MYINSILKLLSILSSTVVSPNSTPTVFVPYSDIGMLAVIMRSIIEV